MTRWNPNFPTNKDYWKAAKIFPGDPIRKSISDMGCSVQELNFLFEEGIHEWQQVLYNKVHKIEIAYTCTVFYYENGIQDIELSKMPEGDMHRKIMFDFFVDMGLYSVYSAFDVIGHILNNRYNLGIDDRKIYFGTAVDKLKDKDNDLFKKLDAIRNTNEYRKGKIRNDFAHNIPPTEMLGFVIERKNNVISMKENDRKLSSEMMETFKDVVDLLQEAANIIK